MELYQENSGWMPAFPMEYMAQAYLEELLTQPKLNGDPSSQEVFNFYKPIIKKLVLADQAYQNACRNSDREAAIFEGDAAVKRAALVLQSPVFRLYSATTAKRPAGI